MELDLLSLIKQPNVDQKEGEISPIDEDEASVEIRVLPASGTIAEDSANLEQLDVELLAKKMHKLVGEVEELKADASRRESAFLQHRISSALRDAQGNPAMNTTQTSLDSQTQQRMSVSNASQGVAAGFMIEMESQMEALRNDMFRELRQFRADVGSRFSEVTFTVEQTNTRIGTAASMRDLKALEAVIDMKLKAHSSENVKRQLESAHELDAKLYEDLGKIAAWKQKLEENIMERVRHLERGASDTATTFTTIKNEMDARMKAHGDDMEATREWVRSKLHDLGVGLKEDGARITQLGASLKNFELDMQETENMCRECFKELRRSEMNFENRAKDLLDLVDNARSDLNKTNQELRLMQTELDIMNPRINEVESNMEINVEELSKARARFEAQDKRFSKVESEMSRIVDAEVGFCRKKIDEAFAAIAENSSKAKHQFDVHEKDIKALADEMKKQKDTVTTLMEDTSRDLMELRTVSDTHKLKLVEWDYMKPKIELALENLSQTMRRVVKLEDQRKDFQNIFSELRGHIDDIHNRLPQVEKGTMMLSERMSQVQSAILLIDQKAGRGGGGAGFPFPDDLLQKIADLQNRIHNLEEHSSALHQDINNLKDQPRASPDTLAPMTIKVTDGNSWADEMRRKSRDSDEDDGDKVRLKRMNSTDLISKMQSEIQELGRRVSRAPFLLDRANMLGNMCVQYEDQTRKKAFCPPISEEWRAVMARTVHDVANFIATSVDINTIASHMIFNPEIVYEDDEIGRKRQDACTNFMRIMTDRVLQDHPDAGVLKLEARGIFFRRVSEGLDMALSKFEKILVIGQSRISATVPKCIACDRPLLSSQTRINKDLQDGLEQPSLLSEASLNKSSSSWGSRNLGALRPGSSKKHKQRMTKKQSTTASAPKLNVIGNEGSICSRDWTSPRPLTAPGNPGFVMRGGFKMPKSQLQLSSPEFVAELVEEQQSKNPDNSGTPTEATSDSTMKAKTFPKLDSSGTSAGKEAKKNTAHIFVNQL